MDTALLPFFHLLDEDVDFLLIFFSTLLYSFIWDLIVSDNKLVDVVVADDDMCL